MSNDLQSFDKLKADITLHVKPIFAIEVKDVDTQKLAFDSGKQIKSYQKLIEEKRKELVAPLNAKVKEINDYAKKISEPLNKAEDHVKKELRDFEFELERIKQEEMRKAEEERRRKEAEALAIIKAKQEEAEMSAMLMSDEDGEREKIAVQAESERTIANIEKETLKQEKDIAAMKVAGSRKVWTFKVKDLSQVPREFMVLDEKRVREAIKAEIREIPGLEIYQETTIALR